MRGMELDTGFGHRRSIERKRFESGSGLLTALKSLPAPALFLAGPCLNRTAYIVDWITVILASMDGVLEVRMDYLDAFKRFSSTSEGNLPHRKRYITEQ
jgi:hypothetical protein